MTNGYVVLRCGCTVDIPEDCDDMDEYLIDSEVISFFLVGPIEVTKCNLCKKEFRE